MNRKRNTGKNMVEKVMEESEDVGNFNCIIIRNSDECSGSL